MQKITRANPRVKVAVAVAAILLLSYILGSLYMAGAPSYAPAQEKRYAGVPSTAQRPTVPSEAGKAQPSTPGTSPGSGDTQPLEPPSRKIIYTASVELEADDVVAAASRVEEIASSLGGYVSWESISTGKRPRAVVTVKVPVDRYREALEEIKSIAKLVSVSQKAEDVTDRYIDLQARLKNLKAEEERLIELLEKARSVSEIIQVEDRLRMVRTQIEYLEAMLKNLERRIEYATITVTITGPEQEQLVPPPDWGRMLRSAIETAYRVIAGLVVLVVGFSPIWLLLAAAYLVYRSRRGRKAPAAQAQGGG